MAAALEGPFSLDKYGNTHFPMKNCEVLVGNDWKFNAHAGSHSRSFHPGFYFNAGMAIQVVDACHRVASHQGFRGFDGNDVAHAPQPTKYATLKVAPKKFTPLRQANDPQRVEIARLLVRATISFVAYHEISHFMLGHLHRYYSPDKPAQLEAGWDRAEIGFAGTTAPIEKYMEFQADTTAATFVLSEGLSRLRIGDDQEEVASNLVAGAAIFAALCRREADFPTPGYPMAGTRLLSVLNCVLIEHEVEAKDAVKYCNSFLAECKVIGQALDFSPLTAKTIRQACGGEVITTSSFVYDPSLRVQQLHIPLTFKDDRYAAELDQLLSLAPEFNETLAPYKRIADQLMSIPQHSPPIDFRSTR